MRQSIIHFRFLVFVSLAVLFSSNLRAQKFTISGFISDSASGEMLIGASIYVKGTSSGAAANAYGFYSLTLPQGNYTLVCSYIGYRQKFVSIALTHDTTKTIQLASSDLPSLKEVEITTDRNDDVLRNTQTSAISIQVEQVRNLPTIGGETDIIKVMQLMPGVKRGGEGQNALFVRGGSGDDNLILLDEAVVYNVSHLFGFFSVFNNDALKEVNMIKGGFPAQYGGRTSSVMDIRMKDGDFQRIRADGGIGLLSSHLTLQGPVIKGKSSFLVSGRRSYIDQVFKLAAGGQNVLPYYFYDANLKLNYTVSDKDRLFLSGYIGDDVLSASTGSDSSFFDGGFRLGNFTTTLRWNHTYNPKLFSNTSLIHTRFRYDVNAFVPGNTFLTKSRISDVGGKIDCSYFHNPKQTMRFGVMYTNHLFRPNVISTSGQISDFLASREGKKIFTNELGIYGNYEAEIDSNIRVNGGVHLSALLTVGGKVFAHPEPRASAAWNFRKNQSLKLSYSKMVQYLHLVSSSSIALPTDLWYPVTNRTRPPVSHQIAMAYNYNFAKLKTLLTLEAYYKWIRNLIEYREGAQLILNDNYEDELIRGRGRAYGFELFAQRQEGRITGWVGYTLSWSIRQFDGLNRGNAFYAKFDRRHDISVVGMWQITKRLSFSAVWVYSTGQRFTPITGNFLMPNSALTAVDILPIYSDRNALQLPPAHRLDINFVIKSRLDRKWMLWVGEWQIGAYNVYNRAQPYRVDIIADGVGGFKYQARGLFGFIPSIAYNFRF